MEPLWLAMRDVLRRAPLLIPLVVVCCVISGGVLGWVVCVLALTLCFRLGLRKVGLCAVMVGLVVWLTQGVQLRREQDLLAALAQNGAVELSGVVVQRLPHSCVVQTPWPGLRVAVQGAEEWRLADEVHLVGELLPVTPPPAPGMFSTQAWMRGQGICARLSLLSGEVRGSTLGWWRLVRLAGDIRARLAARLMPPDTQADPRRQTLCALLLGEKSLAEPDTLEVFRRGGCLHVFAVSGLHVGLLAGILGALLRLLRVRPQVGRWLLLLLVGGYVLVTGLAAPALRAFLLLAAVLFGLILRRRPTLMNAWCFAALFLLLLRPSQLYQAGFQLSFAIYAAISLGVRYGIRGSAWFGPDSYIPRRLYTPLEERIVHADMAVRGVLLVSLCAWFASIPFSMLHFHVLNTTSYITNTLITPLLPLVMCCGLLALCFGWLPWVGSAFHWLALQCTGGLIWLVGATSSYPGAFLPAHEPAPPSAAMVTTLRYGDSFAVLGNPGVLVGDIGHEKNARYEIEPAVFHSGYRPAIICGAAGEAARIYARSWPAAQLLPYSSGGVYTCRTAAGRYSFYYPSAQSSVAAGSPPVIVWEQISGRRVIYVGNAAASTLAMLPEPERRADVIILGYNARDPVLDSELPSAFRAGELLLLPAAEQLPQDLWNLPATRLRRLPRSAVHQLPGAE